MHGLEESLSEQDRLKSRRGSIPANVSTLMKTAVMASFTDELAKLSADEVAVADAVNKLQRPRPWKTVGQTAALVGTVAPAIDLAGRFTKGFVDTKGGIGARAAGGLANARTATLGDLASKALTSGLGGGAIAVAKEGIEVHNARKAVHDYLQKTSMFGAPPASTGPKVSTPSAPTLGVLRGSSNKSQRVGNTPIAAKSGVTSSASGDAMNPRRNLGDAMKAY